MMLFPVGTLIATPMALQCLSADDMRCALARHQRGDWGHVDQDDRQTNDQGLLKGGRLLSVYDSVSGQRFWIITEADRSATTVLMPDEY